MNKTLLTLSLLLGLAAGAKADVTINATNFPDANFRNWVLAQDYGADGKLTNAEIADVTTINVSNKGIADLTGIEYFTAMTILRCADNQLTTIDLSKNTKLAAITCSGNKINGSGQGVNNFIKNLPTATTSNSGLFFYDSEASTGNWMSTVQVEATRAKGWLPQKKKSGTSFWSDYTGLEIEGTAINATNFPDEKFRSWVLSQYYGADAVLTAEEIAGVTEIDVREKNIASLQGIEYFTALTRLYCFTNQLKFLDVSNNTALTMLDCGYNQLTSLDLSNNTALTELLCLGNQLTSLDLSNNTALTSLYCYNNQIQGKGMATLVNSLPEVTNGTFVVYNNEGTEGNEITTAQVAAAKKKGWSVQTSSGNDYPGVEIDGIAIDATNFPDDNFRTYVSGNTIDKDGDGYLNDEEIAGVTEIDVSEKSISNLKGIEYFTALKTLECVLNDLTSLDLSKNTALTYLNCYINQLTSLDLSKNTALIKLICDQNKLTSLNVSGCTALTYLDCNNNQLASLDVSNNTALTYLDCTVNQLASLDVSGCTALTKLYCADNHLTTLDVSKNTALIRLNCYSNQLTSLNVSGCTTLTSLDCQSNPLTTLNVSGCTALTELYCYEINQLTSLDVSGCTALTTLSCADNQLTSLDVSGCTALTELYCADNQLTTIDLSKNTALTKLSCGYNQLTSLDVSNNTALVRLSCNNNQLNSLDLSNNTALTELYCYENNQLTSLDVSGCTALTELYCYKNNQLTSLDVSGCTALKEMYCYENNQLTSLDVSGCTALKEMYCYKNQNLTSLTGLKNHPSLEYLNIEGEKDFTYGGGLQLDVSGSTKFKSLYGWYSNLTSINVSGCTAFKGFYCDYSKNLKTVDVSGCTAFTNLTIYYCALTSINASGCTSLTTIIAESQQLSSLDVSGCTALQGIWCQRNYLRGEGMTALINSLPDRSTTSAGRLCIYYNEESNGNMMTTVQVTAAKAKNWMPEQYNGSVWIAYDGVAPGIAIDETNFPDDNFRAYVSGNTIDKDRDGYLSDEEIAGVTEINVILKNIESLTGIEYFTALTSLDCGYNQLTSLDVSKNTVLTYLGCYGNQLTSLDLSKNTELTSLRCDRNQLTSLDVSGFTALTYLSCSENQLTSLDVSNNTTLTTLLCGSNEKMTSLDVSGCTALTELQCDYNQLTSLNVSGCTTLTTLHCYENQLTSLDVSGCTALTDLYCQSNQIRGEGMTALVNSLPDRSKTSAGWLIVYSYSEGNGNMMTTVQVAAAKAKNWMPKQYGGAWVDYEGVNIEGDANGNGVVDAQDIATIRDYILGLDPQPFSFESANLNGDSAVDIQDLTKLIQLLTE